MFSAQLSTEEHGWTENIPGTLVATALQIVWTAKLAHRRAHMDRVYRLWIRFNHPRSGQSMAEYALVVTLVAAAGLAVWSTLGGNIKNVISSVANCI